MFYIGCHLSASDGFLAMGKTALSIGANTFQFFTRNPRGSKAKAIDPADVAAFLALAAENGFGTLVAHAPYTINPCSKDEHTREFARMTLADDLKRMEHIPGNVYNFHPGSHTGQGMETGIGQIAETLNAILTPDDYLFLQKQGAVGDILSHFIDIHGHLIDSDLEKRLMSPPLTKIENFNNVVGVAGGPHKIEAIYATLMGSYLDVLITDEDTAAAILELYQSKQ